MCLKGAATSQYLPWYKTLSSTLHNCIRAVPQVREAQGIKDTDEDRRRDRNRQAMAEAYDKSSMKARALNAQAVYNSILCLLCCKSDISSVSYTFSPRFHKCMCRHFGARYTLRDLTADLRFLAACRLGRTGARRHATT